MFLITIGTDRHMFDANSTVRKRMMLYSTFCKTMKVIVFTRKQDGFDRLVLNNVIEIIPTNSVNRFFYIYDALRIIGTFIRKQRPVSMVVSCQDPFETGVVGWYVSHRYHLPLHIQVHTDIGSIHFKTSSLLNRIRMMLAPVILRRANSIRVVSPRISNYLVQIYHIPSERIEVLPIVNMFTPVDRIEGAEKYILIVSRLESEKCIDQALRICAPLLQQDPRLILKIAGSGRKEQELRVYASQLGIAQQVMFLGTVSDMAPLYAGARCLLHTSLYEGFGLVLYEAALSGCPIVTTDVGIAQDLKMHNYRISICDLHDMSCMEQALKDNTQRFMVTDDKVVLDFVPHTVEVYKEKYKKALYKALES